ncbi:MAG: two-component regulator propeller domain-containing protein [Taibaiella sp.]|jgi:ligand-binding sensor domain-containing protein
MSKQNFIKVIAISAVAAFCTISPAVAQQGGPAVEQWKSYLPYNQVNAVATDGTTFFCSTTSGFFTYNREDGSLNPYSKVSGMSDVGMTGVGYDKTTRSALLAYSNSNIDIFKDGSFYNIPDLKSSQGSGDKTIHDVNTDEGLGYLSSGIGLLIINMDKKEVKGTVQFSENGIAAAVYASAINNTYLYAATSVGLFRTEKTNPFIQNYNSWTKLDDKIYHYLANASGTIYAAEADSLFELSPTNVVSFKEKIQYPISHLDNGAGGLWISAVGTDVGFGILRAPGGNRIDSFFTISPSQIVQLANGDVWFGDNSSYAFRTHNGLRKKTGVAQSEPYFPDGPVTSSSFDVSAYNGDLWVAHGGKDVRWNPIFNKAKFSHFSDNKWTNVDYIAGSEWFQDFIRILKDPNSGNLYVASFSGGLYERDANGNITTYRGTEYFSNQISDPKLFLISGMALDPQGNLWMTNNRGIKELAVKTADNQWYKMKTIDGNTPDHTAADVLVDDYGQKWFNAVASGGTIVYNDNGTISNTADDQYRILKVGEGAGNLPDNNTTCIAKDRDGAIWIGTENGIGIVNCPDQVINRECEATLKVVQLDQFAGYLFEGQSIRAIAVDGANRKWIGTSNGVWLLSEDAESIVYRFNESNSPLPSNAIERINIDPVTGDVYFSTDKGLIAFRSTATEGKEANEDELFIYPNPVPSGFEGMIAVRGVAENADVRFTDISGQLVYRTKALGGQAVWSGKDYTGRKVQSGVYLVFVVNKDGTEKATGKFMIHN